MAAEAVEVADVGFRLPGGRLLLDGVSLRVEAGTTTALLGRSGSGKTTLLRTVNALVRPTSGHVLVGGRAVGGEMRNAPERDVIALRRSIGYVIQETGLFPHRTIARNVGLALELRGESEAAQRARAVEMLELVGLGAEFAERYPWQLSGGQRQRAGLARALAGAPSLLLLDEPFGALDPLTRREMQDVLRDLLVRTGVTALLVTHDLNEALYLAQQVVFLDEGRVRAVLAVSAVRGSKDAFVKRYLAATESRGGEAATHPSTMRLSKDGPPDLLPDSTKDRQPGPAEDEVGGGA